MVQTSGFSKQQTRIRRAAENLKQHLGIDVKVNLRKMKQIRPDKYGFAYYFMDQHGICIFGDCPDDMLGVVISHEMVHVHQTVRGDLKFDHDSGTFWWKGDRWDPARLDEVKYYDRPWEAEAKHLEAELSSKFF